MVTGALELIQPLNNVKAPGLEHFYLEDSYFLRVIAEGTKLRLRVLFVLTADHPQYVSPLPGEQHC